MRHATAVRVVRPAEELVEGLARRVRGHTWTAKWWTQGDIPGNNSQAVWTDNGAC